ncbi:helix-turn-helix transcriptional regulator [Actinoplanes sp. NPDC024001]|uniref:helix-turn-helix domain-containing protein n=1 Tax=Actinoplanes sp. NPDC024001 TaxID=3154598 RepID=UPI0033F09303
MTPPSSIGDRIRARRLLRGWSIRYAASRAGVSHASWSRIERGLQAADNRFMLADLAAALDCSPTDLAGTAVPAADREAVAAHARVSAVRQALVEADLNEPLEQGGGSNRQPEQHGGLSEPPERHGDLREPPEQRGGLNRPPGRPAELGRALALVDQLRRACDYAGAARLLPDLLRGLHAAGAGPERAAALRQLCDATFIASSVLRNLGCPAEAWLGAERCRDAAHAAQDPILRGYAEYARACAAAACGSYERAYAIAERAVNGLCGHTGKPGGTAVLGTLQLMCAQSARGSRRPGDSRAWLDEAAALARGTGETATMGLYFGPTNVAIWRIGIEADGGEPGRAVAIARGTDPAVIAAGFRQVFYYADTARALARVRGRDREAIRYLLIAERIAPQHLHTSAMAQETTRALLERSRRAAGGSELRGLCTRMQIAV